MNNKNLVEAYKQVSGNLYEEDEEKKDDEEEEKEVEESEDEEEKDDDKEVEEKVCKECGSKLTEAPDSARQSAQFSMGKQADPKILKAFEKLLAKADKKSKLAMLQKLKSKV